MITKEYISEIKFKDNNELANLIKTQKDENTINLILENLGKLPKNFNGEFLYELLEHSNSKIRLNTVKNLGKLNNQLNNKKLFEVYKKEINSNVKKEIISSIGRQRKLENKEFLFECLEDNDPKIVCQAIRALLIFKKDEDVNNNLKKIINHPNEMVREIINKEYLMKITENNNEFSIQENFSFLKNLVINADILEFIKFIPNESIHLTFTSPPYYNARDYSIYQSYNEYLQFLDKVFKEVHRITKEGRFLVVNTSPIIIPRISRSYSSKRYPIPFDLHYYLVKQGWDFIDDIIWLKPEASAKNRIGGFIQHKKPLAYKPNCITEYLMVYRKSTDKLIDWNIKNYDQNIIEESKVTDDYEKTNVWKIDPTFDKVHSAVFPIELCKKVIQYYSYKGDLIFDPFAGSGTVGEASRILERFFLLVEKEIKYFDYIKKKLKQKDIFEKIEPKFFTLEEFKGKI